MLGKGVSEAIRGLSEAIPRLPKYALLFFIFESFVVPEMSFLDQSTGLELSLSAPEIAA